MWLWSFLTLHIEYENLNTVYLLAAIVLNKHKNKLDQNNRFYGKEILVLFQEGELNKKKHLKTLQSDTFRDSIETICHGVTEHCTGCLIISQYGWGFARRYPCFKLHVLSCRFEHTKTLHRYSCQFAERCTTENHVIVTERYVWVMFLNLFLITS